MWEDPRLETLQTWLGSGFTNIFFNFSLQSLTGGKKERNSYQVCGQPRWLRSFWPKVGMFEISLLPHHQTPRTIFSVDIVSEGWKVFPGVMSFTFLFLDLLQTLRTDTFRNVKILKVIKLVETNQGNKRLSIFYCSTDFQHWNYSNMVSESYAMHRTDNSLLQEPISACYTSFSYNRDNR